MNNVRFLVQNDVDFIVGYPDVGAALAPAVSEAEAEGIPYLSFSAATSGCPDRKAPSRPVRTTPP